MNRSSGAPSYDLFKLIIALILLLIFLFLLFWMRPSQVSQPDELVAPPPQSPTVVRASSTSPPLAATPVPTPTLEPIVSQTPTTVPSPTEMTHPTASPTPTVAPSPTATSVPESTPTPIAVAPEGSSACEPVSRAQLQVGMRATITHYLNFRSSPGISNNWILTNAPGTQVEIMGGPECTRHEGGSYLWWQIKLPDGQIGWSAEASASGAFYFMEPTD